MIPDLFLLGGLDLVTGLMLLSMHAPNFKVWIFGITPDFIALLAIAVILKGVYSLAYGMVAR